MAFDRLDEAFVGFFEVELPVLRALFRTYLNLLAFKQLKLKLFHKAIFSYPSQFFYLSRLKAVLMSIVVIAGLGRGRFDAVQMRHPNIQ